MQSYVCSQKNGGTGDGDEKLAAFTRRLGRGLAALFARRIARFAPGRKTAAGSMNDAITIELVPFALLDPVTLMAAAAV